MFSCMGKSESRRHQQLHRKLCLHSAAKRGETLPPCGENRTRHLTYLKRGEWLHRFMLCWVICDIFSSNLHFVSIFTHSLVVERHHLAADVPERLWAVIRWVHSCSFRVNPAHLPFIIPERSFRKWSFLKKNLYFYLSSVILVCIIISTACF